MKPSADRPITLCAPALVVAALVFASASLAQTPSIRYVHATTLSPGVVRLDAGIDPMGTPGEVWFRWFGVSDATSPEQPMTGDSGNVAAFSTTIYYPVTGNFTFWVAVRAAGDTIYSEGQYSTSGDSVHSPDVGAVEVDSTGTTSLRLSASCNPRGGTVSFKFAWSIDPATTIGLSPAVTFGPFDRDTVIRWNLELLTPNTEYYLSAAATVLGSEGAVGVSVRKIRATTLYDSSARGLTVPIVFRFTDAAWPYIYTQARNFGVNTSATDCYDYGLGEEPIPPPPPAPLFDVRFIDRYQGAAACLTDGAYTDIRRYRDSTQVDTFHVRIINGWNYVPIGVSWTGLGGLYAGPVMLRSPIDSADMRTTTHYEITHPAITTLIITAAWPRPVLHAPNLLVSKMGPITETNARLEGTVNPNGLPTTAWFEWGETEAYDRQTPPEQAGSGFTVVNISTEVSGLEPGAVYHYRIVAANSAGTLRGPDQTFATTEVTGAGDEPRGPAGFRLDQNYPNPFNPSTEVRYSIPLRAHVTLVVYDALGRVAAKLVDAIQPPGEHTARWDAAGVPGGAYFCRIVTSDGFSRAIPMLLLR
jgi:hypothetical protein